jgi:hypothetical protein
MKLFSVFMIFFVTYNFVWAQECNPALKINYLDGENGCLTDIPISKLQDKRWGRPIYEVARNSGYYVIVGSTICNKIEIGTGPKGVNQSVESQKNAAQSVAFGQCPKSCECTILVEDGKVLVPKNSASLLGGISSNVVTNLSPQDRVIDSSLAKLENENRLKLLALEAENKAKLAVAEKARMDAEAERLAKDKQESTRITQEKLKNEAELRAKLENENRLKLLALEAENKAKLAVAEKARMDAEAERLAKDKLRIDIEKQTQVALLQKEKEKAEDEIRMKILKEQSDRQAQENAKLIAEVEKLKQQLSKSEAIQVAIGNRKALVFGNNNYKNIAKLENALEDAKIIAQNLAQVGYSVTLKTDLTEKEMKAAIRIFKGQVNAGDEVAIFYAGHGVQLGSTNYLLPVDVGGDNEEQVKDEGVPLQRLLDDMTERKAKFTLAMLDACRDNPFKVSGRSIGGGTRGLAPTSAATGQMVVFSAGNGQQAMDKLGPSDKNKNGVFTRVFVKEMQKSGLTIDRIVKNVRNEVAELAKSVGHEQVPAIYDQVLGDFYFKLK